MKDAKEALYCMGQMADKCLTSLGAIQKDYKEFVSLVRKMREAQKQWRDGDPFDYTEVELAKRMDETEKEVDEWLKKLK